MNQDMRQVFSKGRHSRRPTAACLWMQAGVVNNKPCFKDFHCEDCRFDQAMTRVCRANHSARRRGERPRGKSGAFEFWQDKLNRQPPSRRPCIHHMKGRIDFKACPKSYHCADCEFDQFFQDRFKVYARVEEVAFTDIRGFSLPSGYYLGAGHVWVKLERDGQVSMGIDDFAARLLGRFDTLSAPLMGKEVIRGGPAFTLGREGNAVTFISPLSGVVTDVNPRARKRPDKVARTPYTDGWVLTLHCPALKNEVRDLMFMESATDYMDDCARELHGFLEEETGLKAADGGQLVPDIYGALPHVSWEELVSRFIA